MHPLATNDILRSPLGGVLRIDQLAFIARSDKDEASIKRLLRLQDADWVVDEVMAEGRVAGHPEPSINVAKLMFNYDLGVEVEILRYLSGPNYADEGRVPSCQLVHVGMHLDGGNPLPDALRGFVFATSIAQEVETRTHTNEFLLKTGRRYRYTIYDTRPLFGVYLKVIERLEAKE